MNTIKTAAIFLFAAIAAGASHAADPAERAAERDADRVRAQVRHELRQAIAAGEIRHGDLADFQQLVAPAASHRALTDRRKRDSDGANAGVAATQSVDGNSGTFAHAASSPR